MNILAIDTSSKIICLGFLKRNGRIFEYNLDTEQGRCSELLLPTIKNILRDARLSLSEVDYFAVGLGPGSFTGLRIGLATIKGFAIALGTPVVGIASLDILAANAPWQDNGIICPVIDAKRNLIYSALYEFSNEKKLRRKSPYLLINIDELLKRIFPYKSITFLGDGLNLYQYRLIKKTKNYTFLEKDTWHLRAENLIKLALDSIEQGRRSDARALNPIYLYPKECQIRYAKDKK